jgi:drug/metabolite transporter (DMT)-like permease
MISAVVISSFFLACSVIATKLALSKKANGGFLYGAIFYTIIGIFGVIFGRMANASFPSFTGIELVLLLICGFGFPLAGITSYYIVKYAGAGNAAVLMVLHFLFLALGAVAFLGETLTQILGCLILLVSALFAVIASHGKFKKASIITGTVALLNGLVYFFAGPAEKTLIDSWGLVSYISLSFPLQALCAWMWLFMASAAIGTKITSLKDNEFKWAMIAGVLTCVGAFLYLYALKDGTLAQIGVASSLKIIFVALLASILFKETKYLQLRIGSLLFSTVGLLLLFS